MTDTNEASTRPHDTLMWEVRAAPARLPELLAWVRERAVPELLTRPGCLRVEVFDASDERVVVIARFAGPAARLPDPPAGLLRREPHAWPFRHLSTHRPAAG
ncbi:hypothetical protein I6A60_38490 [Frankia sp. AgB1.9]|uniref:hypothetical protein n=1 Tax=unclassified Frankia TaxID=2632575 RepID=UPI0019314CDB|nr:MULTISPECIES: hypothetical protein [unclassified Frankia]MBL7491592.1 hypothetical protein [Frankia sp. AgW1.1]MBL7553678.1 hypothetical protein [Frankia sp. AgB1.9]MBL7617672.1 hypothetical protein [Frankia sp. AgB1.8]